MDAVILIVGGMAQGKRQFAEALLSEGRLSERLDESRPVRWADGGQVSLEEFAAAPFGCHAQLLIRRLLERDPSLTTDPQWTSIAAEEQLGRALTELLLRRCRDRIVTAEEIGNGIVPLDPMERLYREQAGRVCCQLAGAADQVWRVCCGIGGRIK